MGDELGDNTGPRFSAVVMVAMTGYGQPWDRERSKEAGCDLHLTKPADITELLNFLASSRERPKWQQRPAVGGPLSSAYH